MRSTEEGRSTGTRVLNKAQREQAAWSETRCYDKKEQMPGLLHMSPSARNDCARAFVATKMVRRQGTFRLPREFPVCASLVHATHPWDEVGWWRFDTAPNSKVSDTAKPAHEGRVSWLVVSIGSGRVSFSRNMSAFDPWASARYPVASRNTDTG